MSNNSNNVVLLSLLALYCISTLCSFACGAERWNPDPVPNPKAVVTVGQARFTVLTPQLIRLEYSSVGLFRDNATFTVLNRHLPVPSFTTNTTGGSLTIKTSALELQYILESGIFTADNLKITLTQQINNNVVVWNIDTAPTGNLLGTVRTLDDVDGSYPLYCPYMSPADRYNTHCTLAPFSRDGWAVYNDSVSPIWDNSPWPWFNIWDSGKGTCSMSNDARIDCMLTNEQACEAKGCCFNIDVPTGYPICFYPNQQSFAYQDYYFYGHGHNYSSAIADLLSLSGPIPVLPRYIFGPQYSRWHAFNEKDEVAILQEGYEAAGVPLDVLVLDMDWHNTWDRGGPACNPKADGWTGYTWDTALFPDPARFLTWAHKKGLHITNNMHPADGVQCSERLYPQFAKSMGVDPNSSVTIPYAMHDKKYATNFFEIVLQPLANQGSAMDGIDYWWIDYQQGETLVAPGVNPTFWVNYVFSSSAAWWGKDTRPLIMARWGGLGNHRFSDIGFSGDTVTSWESLAFQPYFTVTATNVGFFWSHDLGGFNGQPEPELYVRWIQWGLFSNMLRTHCYGKLKGGGYTRDIWEYPHEYYTIMREAFLLRSKLVPYMYTQHFQAYLTGSGLLRPLYFLYPEQDDAYAYTGQYLFGSDMFVSPVVSAGQGAANLTQQSIWVPPGTWVEYLSGQVFEGPSTLHRSYALDEIPAFVRAGAIIPTRSDVDRPTIGSAQQIPSVLRFEVFSPVNVKSSTVVVEDDGITTSYKNGAYASTGVSLDSDADSIAFAVNPVSGSFTGMRQSRSYQFYFANVFPAASVHVNNVDISYIETPYDDDYSTKDFWTYDTSSLSVLVNLMTSYPVNNPVVAKLSFAKSNAEVSGILRMINRAQACKDLLDDEWGNYYPLDYPNLLYVTDFGLNTTTPSVNQNSISKFSTLFTQAIADINGLSDTPDKAACLDLLTTA